MRRWRVGECGYGVVQRLTDGGGLLGIEADFSLFGARCLRDCRVKFFPQRGLLREVENSSMAGFHVWVVF